MAPDVSLLGAATDGCGHFSGAPAAPCDEGYESGKIGCELRRPPEQGERPADGVRELREELGIEAEFGALLPVGVFKSAAVDDRFSCPATCPTSPSGVPERLHARTQCVEPRLLFLLAGIHRMRSQACQEFLRRKWAKELDYRLMKELWCYTDDRISVRFEYEWRDADTGQWMRTHGNEHWEFDDEGLMRRRDMSANDIAIDESERRYRQRSTGSDARLPGMDAEL